MSCKAPNMYIDKDDLQWAYQLFVFNSLLWKCFWWLTPGVLPITLTFSPRNLVCTIDLDYQYRLWNNKVLAYSWFYKEDWNLMCSSGWFFIGHTKGCLVFGCQLFAVSWKEDLFFCFFFLRDYVETLSLDNLKWKCRGAVCIHWMWRVKSIQGNELSLGWQGGQIKGALDH